MHQPVTHQCNNIHDTSARYSPMQWYTRYISPLLTNAIIHTIHQPVTHQCNNTHDTSAQQNFNMHQTKVTTMSLQHIQKLVNRWKLQTSYTITSKKKNDLRKENIHKHKVAERLFDAMSEMKNTLSFLVYNLGSRKGPIANAKPQLQNGTQSFLTYFAEVAKANRKRKTATSAKNSDNSTYANFHLMTWNDDAMWTLVYVVCMHVCVKPSMS